MRPSDDGSSGQEGDGPEGGSQRVEEGTGTIRVQGLPKPDDASSWPIYERGLAM